MNHELNQKVTLKHLSRNAYLYIRQSTLRQVAENRESTKRQYGLEERALSLGWQSDQIVVIDSDLGQSASSSTCRNGFKHLVSEVGMGKAGVVIGLEVSRLARNCSDWHYLLEICGLTGTLILDEEGIYNPCDFNDRLLLGLKGTMSEAELHLIRSRLRGGLLCKARRGELRVHLPIGLIYDEAGCGGVLLDPDQQIRNSVNLLFKIFRQEGSAVAVVKYFFYHKLKFPRRWQNGIRKGEVVWGSLNVSRCVKILHNPRYAGVYCYGRTRTRTRRLAGGQGGHGGQGGQGSQRRIERVDRDQWHAFIKEAHPGYISWEEYEKNQKRLRQNSYIMGGECHKGFPREGPALLQGLVICGKCGRRMSVRYHHRKGGAIVNYHCEKDSIEYGGKVCQTIPGKSLEHAIGELLLECMSPLALDVALKVQEELQVRMAEFDGLKRQQLERVEYQAELARRRYMSVEPENRLVAVTLESEWNLKLQELEECRKSYEQERAKLEMVLDEKLRGEIISLVTDFPAVWKSPATSHRSRKQMVRLIIEDITLIREENITMHIRFKGGAVRTLILPNPVKMWEMHKTDGAVVNEIKGLSGSYTDGEMAEILNKKSHRSGTGKEFTRELVRGIRRRYKLKSRYEHLRERGLLTLKEVSVMLNVSPGTIREWSAMKMLQSYRCNEMNECLYERPGIELIKALASRKSLRKSKESIRKCKLEARVCEVQYEA